jgi:hypothetical protein
MTKKSLVLLLFFMLIGSFCVLQAQSVNRPIDNPQVQMIGARAKSLGGTNPVLVDDINGVFINPAVVGSVEPMPFTASSQKVMGYFDYQFFSASFPMDIFIPLDEKMWQQKMVFGLSYGSSVLRDIPRTVLTTVGTRDTIRPIGSYSSGFDVIAGSAAVVYHDKLGFDRLSAGMNLKAVRHFVGSDTRSAFGMDVGGLASYNLNKYSINRLHVGVSAINVIATPLVWQDKTTSYMPLQPFVGVCIETMEEELALFLHNDLQGVSVGAEWLLHPSFTLRGSTNFKNINIGTGLVFPNVMGFGDQHYGVRVDYNYTHQQENITVDPTSSLSVSVLGEVKPRTPEILQPENTIITANEFVALSGVGPEKTTIRIYNNQILSRTISTDRYGRWKFQYFPLNEGKNEITIKSYSLQKDVSVESDKRVMFLDTVPPSLGVRILPESDNLKIEVRTPSSDISEELQRVDGLIGKERVVFKKGTSHFWSAVVTAPPEIVSDSSVPKEMQELMLFAVDKVGNETGVKKYPFYIVMNFPVDKHVHYRSHIRCIGRASPMMKSLQLEDSAVYVDQNYNFSVTKKLKPGKNLLKFNFKTLDDQKIQYTARVLSLKSFPDLTKNVKERREIQFLATLGLFSGDADGNFYPDREVTRMFITKMMVDATGLKMPEKVDENLFPDMEKDDPSAPYVYTAVNEGLIFAYPDGTFKPDKPLTMAEAIYLLSNAGVIDEETVSNQARYATRKELAKFLAYTPRYEIRIERLINWEKGYK